MSRHLLRRLARLLPEPFRERFADEIREQIERDLEAARERGRTAALGFVVETAFDLVRTALAERWSPTWRGHPPRVPSAPPRKESRTMLEAWIHDFRRAAKSLLRSPGFTLAAVLTLGLAIGVNAGVFSVVDTVLLDPLPLRDADRLVHLAATAPGSDLPEEFGLSAEFLVHYREHAETLEEISLYNSFTSTFRADGRTERIRMSAPSVSLFRTLGVEPILGRLPTEEDSLEVVLISHALWMTWFGGDPDVVGKSFYVSGRDRTVIGVMGRDFWFPNDETLLWFPQVLRSEDLTLGRFGLSLVARLSPGADLEAVRQELAVLARQLPDRFGGSPSYARLLREQHRPVVRPIEEELLGDLEGPLWVLLGAVGLVLVIACANVTNLLLVRVERRSGELALQRALGGTRLQVVRGQMAETLLVAGAGGAAAVGLAWATVPLLVRLAPPEIPRLDRVGVSGSALLFTFAISALAALLCGLGPALRGSRARLARLRQGARGATRRRHWGRNSLIVAQTALSLVLVIGSALLVRSYAELRRVDPGYDTEDLFTFQIAPEGEHLNDAASFARFHTDFARRIEALPGVQSVGLVNNVPLDEGLAGTRVRTAESGGDVEAGSQLRYTWAGGPYFETMGIAILEGRGFTEADHTTSLGNVVLSRTAADLLWPDEGVLGRRLQRPTVDEPETWWTVVGVVEDVLQYSFRDRPEPIVYFPLVGPGPDSPAIGSPAYVVKTARAEEIAPEIRALVQEIAPEAPMYRAYTLAELARTSMIQLSFTMLTLGIAAGLALILGAVGLVGVLSYVVAERTREIGVRMAMGAAPRRVQAMVVAQGLAVVVVGIVIGAGVAGAITRSLDGLLFGVEAVDAATFVWMSAGMVLLGSLASWLPARRASAVDPVRSLRSE